MSATTERLTEFRHLLEGHAVIRLDLRDQTGGEVPVLRLRVPEGGIHPTVVRTDHPSRVPLVAVDTFFQVQLDIGKGLHVVDHLRRIIEVDTSEEVAHGFPNIRVVLLVDQGAKEFDLALRSHAYRLGVLLLRAVQQVANQVGAPTEGDGFQVFQT